MAAARQQMAAAPAVPRPPSADAGMAAPRQQVAASAAIPVPPSADAGMAAPGRQPVATTAAVPRQRRRAGGEDHQGRRSARVIA
uniref:Uncharacterized protein n=1 Tax=Oryza brachyantha TaxID=4533 RepID=J3N692_ORYBR